VRKTKKPEVARRTKKPKEESLEMIFACLHCFDFVRDPRVLFNGAYCERCLDARGRRAEEDASYHLHGARRCAIPGCRNHTDERVFVGDLCSPCHGYVFRNRGEHSQAYRNEVVKASLRKISAWMTAYRARERELRRGGG
jgi:hypothetical protein